MARTASRFVWLALVGCSSHPSSDAATPRHARLEPLSSPVEVHTECAAGSPIYLGETPNGQTGTFLTLRGGSSSHLARDSDGNLTVWLVDDKGFGRAHVRVTRRMKRVEIGRSCDTLHAE